MTLAEQILNNHEVVLAAVLIGASYAQHFLGPHHDFVENTRTNIWRAANPVATMLGRPTVNMKNRQDYICTVQISEEEIEEAVSPQYHRNLISTKKVRMHRVSEPDSSGSTAQPESADSGDGNKDWAEGTWVHKDTPTAEMQHHIYFFDNGDGTMDIYGHYEHNITDPDDHLDHTKQVHGDPNMTLRNALDKAGVEYSEREG